MKNKWRLLPLIVICAILLTACSGPMGRRDMKDAYVLITKSAGSLYNTHMATGFKDVIENRGGKTVILEPEEGTAEAQISLIRECIRGKVRSISIAANGTAALDSVLQEAMEHGIQVSTVDSSTSADSHAVFVNQVSTEVLAQNLMDAIYEITGGSGSWAILSTTNQVGNQTAWIRAMQAIMTQERYQDLRLVSIAFGEENTELSKEKVNELLDQYPDLKVICVPTAVSITVAAEVLETRNSSVKLTGLGLPSEMAPYMAGEDPICPVIYLWNPISVGKLSAYVSMALTDGTITGAPGEILRLPDGSEYTITESPLGGSEVIVGQPQKFTPENIDQWKDVF